MDREEEIRQAALKYSFDTDGGVTCDLNTGSDDFTAGALWSDSHPKSQWHSVADGDLPKEPKGNAEDMPFVVVTKGGEKCFAYFGGYNWDDVGLRDDFFDDCDCALSVIYWMEIPQLQEKVR